MTVCWSVFQSFESVLSSWVPTGAAHVADEPRHGCIAVSGLIKTQYRQRKPPHFQRQIRVAPLHTENTGWILRNVGQDI